MHLAYKNIGFHISFPQKVKFTVPVPFIFRSIIGYQLRKMCCIARNNVCSACMFNATCIYGFIFESIVSKDNPAFACRERISHPMIISSDNFYFNETDSLVLNLVFFGATIPYIPYFYYALKKGGETGIFKERTPYEIRDIIEFEGTEKEKSIKIDDQQIKNLLKPEIWEYNIDSESEPAVQKSFLVTLVSPLRYKVRDKYVDKITAQEFAYCLHRRAQVLCSHYGHNDHPGKYLFGENWTVSEEKVKWRNCLHYSSRQKKEMLLGGLTGSFVMSGNFTIYECSVLNFAEIFHGGKNTSFGLGKIKVSEYGNL